MSRKKALIIGLLLGGAITGLLILPQNISNHSLASNASNTVPTIQVGSRELIMSSFDASGPTYDMSAPTLRHPTQRDKFYTWWVNAGSFKQFLGTVDNPFQTQTSGYNYSNNWNRNGFPKELKADEYTFAHRPWMANIYKHGDGTLIGFVHIETDQYADRDCPGQPNRKVRYRQGISISTNGGVNWKYVGDVIKPHHDGGIIPGRTNDPNTCIDDRYAISNLGGTPLLVVPVQENGQEVNYFYQYYNEVPRKADGTQDSRVPAVARARVEDVVAAALNNTVSSWTKYNRNTGGWTQPGLTGVGSNITWNIDNQTGLNATNPTYPDRYDMHTDAVYSTALGKYILVAWEQAGWDYYPPYNKSQSNKGIYIYTSTDGVNWGDRKKVYTPSLDNEENPYMFFAGGMDHPDTSEDFNIIGGNTFYLYFPDRINHKFYRIPFTINGGNTVPNNTLSVSKNGQGNVTSSTPGISCGEDCAESYPSTSTPTITLSATATGGYTFTGWSGACTGTGTCTIIMNGHKSVIANFSPIALKIMPLGDSITQANGPSGAHPGFPGGYRKKLGELLATSGITYDFVGASTVNPAPGIDPDHNAYPGYRTDEILSRLPNWLSTSDPDIVLLHIGTNDLLQHKTTTSAINNLRQIVRQIMSDSTRELYIAKIIPILKSWEIPPTYPNHPEYATSTYWKTFVDEYNQAIVDLLQEPEFKNNSNIHLVDMTGEVTDPATGESCAIMLCETFDGIHPAQKGLNRMGILLYNALTNNSTTPPIDTPPLTSPSIIFPSNNQILPSNTTNIHITWEDKNTNYLVRYQEVDVNKNPIGSATIINTHSDEFIDIAVTKGKQYQFWIHSGIAEVEKWSEPKSEIFFSIANTTTTDYTLSTSVTSQGIISGNTSPYVSGTTATLTAMPSAGYTFTNWSPNCTAVSGHPNQCTITMNGNKTVTANFALIPIGGRVCKSWD